MSEAIIFHCDVEICGSKIKKGTFVRQKEWIGLTEDEWYEATSIPKNATLPIDMLKRVETKLREKNGG